MRYLMVISTLLSEDRPSNVLWGIRGRMPPLALQWDSDEDQFLKSTWRNLTGQPSASSPPVMQDRKFQSLVIHQTNLGLFIHSLSHSTGISRAPAMCQAGTVP